MNSSRRAGRVLALSVVLQMAVSSVTAQQANAQVVVTQPGPIIVTQPPQVVVGPPVVVRPGFDAYQDAVGRLRSRHPNSRRDGAVTLGKFRDPRAVPDLVWLLQNDKFGEVRTAAAFALGAIGDARASNALRHAASTDKNRQVRQAANHAFGKIMFEAPVVSAASPAAMEFLVEPGAASSSPAPWPPQSSTPPAPITLEPYLAPPFANPEPRS